MKGRLANRLLLVVVPLATLSGFVMFVIGGPASWPALLHGALGLAIVVLAPWKSVVVRRGLRRTGGARRPGRAPRPGRAISLTLSAVALGALATGVAHGAGLLLDRSPVTTLQAHVGAGVAAAVLTAWHARRRPSRAIRGDLSRRTLVRVGAVAVVSVALEVAARTARASLGPQGRRRSSGSFRLESGSVDAIPATQWLFDQVPEVDLGRWGLTVRSSGSARTWSLGDLARWEDARVAVLDCTGGWWTEQEWSGVRVHRLLADGATGTVTVTSATGYRRRLPLTDDLLLATSVGGRPLDAGHGAPLRLVVPGRRGYHWVKWVTAIDHDDRPWWVQPPLPLS